MGLCGTPTLNTAVSCRIKVTTPRCCLPTPHCCRKSPFPNPETLYLLGGNTGLRGQSSLQSPESHLECSWDQAAWQIHALKMPPQGAEVPEQTKWSGPCMGPRLAGTHLLLTPHQAARLPGQTTSREGLAKGQPWLHTRPACLPRVSGPHVWH